MSLLPTETELQARALTDLRLGLPVAVKMGASFALVSAAETIDAARFSELQTHGDLHLALTDWRARTLKTSIYHGDVTRIAVPKEVPLAWLRAMADPSRDMEYPMKGPFAAVRDIDASLDRFAVALLKAAHLLPTALISHVETMPANLTTLRVAPLSDEILTPVASARLPMAFSEAGKISIFRPNGAGEEHYAVQVGDFDPRDPVLVRLHSACFTGDVLGSLKCDCGPQLHAAMNHMAETGGGLLLYLNQEGRGIGLANKMRAYSLQDQGFDTVDANHRLGFEDDERNFELGAQILKAQGINRVRLLTNNPAKVDRLTQSGIAVVERVPLKIRPNDQNRAYLATKAKKSGHIL